MDTIRVLIAEDNELYRQSLYRMLSGEEGMEVLEPARDGSEAVEKAGQLSPDVILMDIDMPEQDGLLATRIIREMAAGGGNHPEHPQWLGSQGLGRRGRS